MNNRNSKNNNIRHSKLTNNQIENKSKEQESTDKDFINQNKKTTITNKEKTSKHKNNKRTTIITILIIFGVTLLVAILGTILGGKMVEDRTLPPLYPPALLFSIVWGVFYVLIALATYLSYSNSHDIKKRNCTLIWYGIHLFFNLFWPLFYFRLDLLIVSCFILLSMVITSIVLTFKHLRTNLIAGLIFTFYSLWLLFAMYLNLGITLLNVV